MSLETLTNTLRGLRVLDVNVSSARLMAHLATTPKPGSTVRDAAQNLGVPKPAITRCMNRLKTLGLATQTQDPHDHRSVYLSLTAKGVRKLDNLAKLTS